jgi:hypothetical protein
MRLLKLVNLSFLDAHVATSVEGCPRIFDRPTVLSLGTPIELNISCDTSLDDAMFKKRDRKRRTVPLQNVEHLFSIFLG